ncbi:TPA: hypothetical protein L5599_003515 [Pseudomonas aeruginosa]|uniref:SH3 domain-containing protein n=3 Tax=Pseudomonas aeruginosa TaxID=287 RepID=UPI00070FBFAD|nr:SH3 domain-containing protein [Pseudomonas aeruginosa]MDY1173891.1 hypothetical protein [Pseudomonas aeruginosa]HBP0911844.1 hypothetical protein [Pseudomonas aeruginosa]HBP4658997.1 hypothetical protein [Pseudomonas aeruginosa]
MEDEKKCPFCAEFIKSEAVKCKHCGSTLASVGLPVSAAETKGGAKKGIGVLRWAALAVIAGGVAFLGFGAYIGSTPEGKARSQARAAIDLCREERDRQPSGSSTWQFVDRTCKKMEQDLRSGRPAVSSAEPQPNYPSPEGRQPAVKVGQMTAPLTAKVFLREFPDIQARVVREVGPGETLVVHEIRDGWIQVSEDKSRQEWAIPDLLDW